MKENIPSDTTSWKAASLQKFDEKKQLKTIKEEVDINLSMEEPALSEVASEASEPD